MFDVQLPHGWAEGSDIMPHIHWSPGNSTDTGAVRWGFEYTWANAEAAPGDAFPATTTIYFDDAAHGVAYSHQIATFPAVSGMGMRKSSVLMCRLFREGGHANDTFNTNAFAISFDLHIQLESSGSITEYPAP
jgi:hypothetical protein